MLHIYIYIYTHTLYNHMYVYVLTASRRAGLAAVRRPDDQDLPILRRQGLFVVFVVDVFLFV